MKGFSLLELLCALTIVGILSAIAAPSYSDYVEQSRREQVKATLTEISVQLTQTRLANSPSVLPKNTSVNQTNEYYHLLVDVDKNGVNYLITATPRKDHQQSGTCLLTLHSTGLGCWYENNDDPYEPSIENASKKRISLCPDNHTW